MWFRGRNGGGRRCRRGRDGWRGTGCHGGCRGRGRDHDNHFRLILDGNVNCLRDGRVTGRGGDVKLARTGACFQRITEAGDPIRCWLLGNDVERSLGAILLNELHQRTGRHLIAVVVSDHAGVTEKIIEIAIHM